MTPHLPSWIDLIFPSGLKLTIIHHWDLGDGILWQRHSPSASQSPLYKQQQRAAYHICIIYERLIVPTSNKLQTVPFARFHEISCMYITLFVYAIIGIFIPFVTIIFIHLHISNFPMLLKKQIYKTDQPIRNNGCRRPTNHRVDPLPHPAGE